MDFLSQIIELTGLPKEIVEKEMMAMIQERGYDRDQLTADNLREILAIYMQETLLGLKKDLET